RPIVRCTQRTCRRPSDSEIAFRCAARAVTTDPKNESTAAAESAPGIPASNDAATASATNSQAEPTTEAAAAQSHAHHICQHGGLGARALSGRQEPSLPSR